MIQGRVSKFVIKKHSQQRHILINKIFNNEFNNGYSNSRNHNESWMKPYDEERFDYNHPRFHVADQGFQCQKTCLIPVKKRDNRHLSRAEKKYNKTLTSFRAINEHAFGNWKDKFPILCDKFTSGIRKNIYTNSQVVNWLTEFIY